MRILDGLDTKCQAPYGFSRYILGPFKPSVLYSSSDDGESEVVIRAAYRHVFGNAYLMEEERAELAIPESQFKLGAMTAKEFVRALAKSPAYKSRFFEGASQYRFAELNFMHLLGRAPDSQAEVSEHIRRYIAEGVDADIDSYIDSEEYASVFGDDNIPFLRFRGAYTPCDSFNKQCALKGGWANSDKAMGGAALSGYNGSDGRQFCDRIDTYATDASTPYEQVAENTPLKTTSPNSYAVPDPALAPTPAFVSDTEVRALQQSIKDLQTQYDAELARKSGFRDGQHSPYRTMVAEMGLMLDHGFAYSGGDPLLANPFAKLFAKDESPLAEGGCKSSDYMRFHKQMENDTLSRIEKDLEEAKASLRVLSKALDASTPLTPTISLPGQITEAPAVATTDASKRALRPHVSNAKPKKATKVEENKTGIRLGPKIGPVTLPAVPEFNLPQMNLPSLPKLPFRKKEK